MMLSQGFPRPAYKRGAHSYFLSIGAALEPLLSNRHILKTVKSQAESHQLIRGRGGIQTQVCSLKGGLHLL